MLHNKYSIIVYTVYIIQLLKLQALTNNVHSCYSLTTAIICQYCCVCTHQMAALITLFYIYEGRSINKLQNGAILSVLKIGKIQNILFVGSLILNLHTTFLDDDVIIVTSADNRTQSICVLFVPSDYFI